MGPNEGWQCNSISAQKKGASAVTSVCAFFTCQFRSASFILMFLFLRFYVTSAFRTSVYGTCFVNYLRWVILLSVFTSVTRCCNFDGPFM